METEKRGRGRPSTGKNRTVSFRISDEEYEKLVYISEKFHMNKADLLRDMIRMQHNLAQFRD